MVTLSPQCVYAALNAWKITKIDKQNFGSAKNWKSSMLCFGLNPMNPGSFNCDREVLHCNANFNLFIVWLQTGECRMCGFCAKNDKQHIELDVTFHASLFSSLGAFCLHAMIMNKGVRKKNYLYGSVCDIEIVCLNPCVCVVSIHFHGFITFFNF